MKILIDQDEVLCEWSSEVVSRWNAEQPQNKRVDEVKVWSTNTFLGGEGRECEFFVRSIMRDSRFWENLRPVVGARDGMYELMEQGHDLRIVTQVIPSVAGPTLEGKYAWIEKNLPWFDLGHVIATKDKASIDGQVLLDDAPHQLLSFAETGRMAVCFDRPWNREAVAHRRVENWPDFVHWVSTQV